MDKLASGYGITTTGFNIRDYNNIMDFIESDLKTEESFGDNIDFSDQDPLKQFTVSIAELLSELWELAQQCFYIASPKYAEGIPLTNTGKFIGISRKQATKATGSIRLYGSPGTLINAGFQVKTETEIYFQTLEDVTIAQSGYIDTDIVAVNSGINGNVATNTIINVVISSIGLNSVTNLSPTTGGQDEETDLNFRTRYEESTAIGSGSTVDAIRANILQVTGVTDCTVQENDTDSTVNSIPPHSIYALVNGGSDTDVAKAIFAKKPGGANTYGTTTIAVTDTQSITHQINFSRPIQVSIYIKVDVTTNSSYPTDGNTQIKNAVLSYIESIKVGESVKIYKINAAITALNLNGIDDMNITLSTDGTTYNATNIAIDADKIAITDLSKIEVV